MIETLRHTEAFEFYYLSGDTRALPLVSQKYNVSLVTAKRWSSDFNWQKRVELRDIENAKSLEKKTNKAVVNSKADYRAEIKTQIGILKAILNKTIKDFKGGKIIDVENTGDLKDVINSYEKLCKLDLLMMGEYTEKGELKIIDARQKFINQINSIANRTGKNETT